MSDISFEAWAIVRDAWEPIEDAPSTTALERTKARQHINDVALRQADDYVE